MNNLEPLEIEIDPELFNDLYFHLEKDFQNEDVRFIFMYGGSSASKTFTFCQLCIIRMLSESENTMILRKFGVDIKDSIYSDFVGIINDWGLSDFFKCQINYIECLLTGSYIRFRGLDDSEKIKGLTGFKRVVLEEISQFDEVDFKQVRKRLRGMKGQQIIGIFNPISEDHWLKTLFDSYNLIEQPLESNLTSHHISEDGSFVIYKVTYLNNYYIVGKWDKNGNLIGGFVDKHTIADFEKDKVTDFAYYQIYGLGNWGKIRTGGEFWKDFNANYHVQKTVFDENLPLHLSFDENVNPYITCLIFQIQGKKAVQIDEICLLDPLNRRHHVANEIKKRYPSDKVKGMFIYGDRTSLKEDTGKEKGENFFTDFMQYLKEYRPTLRLPNVNPSVIQSGGFINSVWSKRVDTFEIVIGDICKKSIADYTYALEDVNGGIAKTLTKNKVTGVSYQEWGHQSDAIRYFITIAFANEYQIYLRGNRDSKPISLKTISTSKNNY